MAFCIMRGFIMLMAGQGTRGGGTKTNSVVQLVLPNKKHVYYIGWCCH